jgi:integrase
MLSLPCPASLCHTPKLLSLSWEDVDFDRRTIIVHATYAKNGESRRVPMNDVLTTTLKVVRMNTLADSLAFCSYKGIPYRSFRLACELAGRKAGLENFTVHDLGHTFASRLVMAGSGLPNGVKN